MWPINSSDMIQNVKFVLPGKVNCLAGSGTYLIAGIKESIFVWHVPTGKILAVLSKHFQQVNCLKFIDDGSHFVSGGDDGQVIVWSLSAAIGDRYRMESCEPLHIFSDHALPVTDLWIGCGGLAGILASVSKDRTCKLYDLASGSMLLSLVFREMITTLTIDRLETELFIGTSLGNIFHHRLQPPPRTREYHITDENMINNKFIGHSKAITCLATTLDEQTLISGSEDCNVIIWNIPSRSILKTLPHKGSITNISLITTPQIMFNREAKLELITKNFQRVMNNAEEMENVEILHTHEISCRKIKSSNYTTATQSTSERNTNKNNEVDELRREVEKLKRINSELAAFAAKKTISN
jgi:pre-rRNA-processing protein IPI3